MDVPKCAQTLRLLVHQMCEDCDRRTANGPLDIGATAFLARTLTDIVQVVCYHNRDIYEGSSWNRNQEANEPERERNLYAHLINPPLDPSFLPWMRDHFVIDRLRAFPANVWRQVLFERLATIKENIEQRDTNSMPGSRAYASRIGDLLHEYSTTADEPSSSSAQPLRASA